jgi:filamin
LFQVRNPHFGKEVTASGKGLYHTRVGKATSFIIHTLGRASKEFDVIVSGPPDVIPPNEAVPVRCYQQKDGNLLAEFVTRTSGAFKIDVLENMRPIIGSPFQCLSYDPAKVKVVGIQRDRVHLVDETISFRVERTEAGFAELDVTVTSPLGGELPLDIKRISKEKEVDLVEFIPEAAGNYKFVIMYGGEQVPGSPINFSVEDRRSNELRVYGDGLSSGQVLYFKNT